LQRDGALHYLFLAAAILLPGRTNSGKAMTEAARGLLGRIAAHASAIQRAGTWRR
jgi:hypothetical protein